MYSEQTTWPLDLHTRLEAWIVGCGRVCLVVVDVVVVVVVVVVAVVVVGTGAHVGPLS